MRIAVVGATGNAGTAVLRELAARDEVESILGIARRLPNREMEPYRQADWQQIDIQFERARADLEKALNGYDAVIHLAWLIQPNKERDLLRRANVDGTRHVLEAAAAAGVRHIVVASSVGAYSPVDDDELRDESWPTEGIESSHYSVDKAAQERVIDEFEAAHPEVTVARLRPALKFQGGAGSEIQRYFLGKWAPVQLLQLGRPPVIPFPKDVRAQAVHTDDVARAYVLAALKGAEGAFNICADDVLDAARIGGVVTGNSKYGRVVPVPSKALRPLIKAAHRTGVLAADEGWLDMALRVPLMDNSRAKRELDWWPSMSGAAALEELIQGMAEGSGKRSAPMRPRDPQSTAPFTLPDAEHQLPEDIDALALRQYMSDHLAGATAGLNRIQKLAEAFMETPKYGDIATVAEEIRVEHHYLEELIQAQGFPRPGVTAPALWVGERLARIKSFFPQGVKITPSVLVLETELMMSAVTGKLHGWRSLMPISEALGVPQGVFEELADDALRQYKILQDVHDYARQDAFNKSAETDPEDALPSSE
ncbi:hypothetical protein GCM10023190_16410 [Enteractinococcus fodinae]|uniref:Nucleoside-diphosphate-sugar epimerase n=1 Tax=Enteractinococcus fodinae TaxID=684663 RepID=A0ABU2AXX1_9MICC|nr:NAD-dependent epimerase/dehydratase family protein [Enteractinococcus fodinae]MDR7345886.1 nucleoside-diphosphate-sugar epimerase [Enteractinococcus fodinae]